MFKVKLRQRNKTTIYKRSSNLEVSGHSIKFETECVCFGDSTTEDGRMCHRQLWASTHAGLEGIIPNPIEVIYEPIRNTRLTKITAYQIGRAHV